MKLKVAFNKLPSVVGGEINTGDFSTSYACEGTHNCYNTKQTAYMTQAEDQVYCTQCFTSCVSDY